MEERPIGRGGRKIRQEMWVARRFTAKIEGAAAWRPSRTEELQLREGTEGRRGRKAKGGKRREDLLLTVVFIYHTASCMAAGAGAEEAQSIALRYCGGIIYILKHTHLAASCGYAVTGLIMPALETVMKMLSHWE